jgi:hypothetical protein
MEGFNGVHQAVVMIQEFFKTWFVIERSPPIRIVNLVKPNSWKTKKRGIVGNEFLGPGLVLGRKLRAAFI